jgi:hypothetical protein
MTVAKNKGVFGGLGGSFSILRAESVSAKNIYRGENQHPIHAKPPFSKTGWRHD